MRSERQRPRWHFERIRRSSAFYFRLADEDVGAPDEALVSADRSIRNM
jgi:hypothetical protein